MTQTTKIRADEIQVGDRIGSVTVTAVELVKVGRFTHVFVTSDNAPTMKPRTTQKVTVTR